MGRRRKSAYESLAPVSRKTAKRSQFWFELVVGLILIIALGAWFVMRKQPPVIDHPATAEQSDILHWSKEKIIETPENTKNFIEARIAYLAKTIPDEVLDPNDLPIKSFLEDFLVSGEMKWSLDQIVLGKKSLQNPTGLSLTFLPDWHANKYFPQDEKSKVRQGWIVQTIRNHYLPLAFIEGVYGPISLEGLHKQAEAEALEVPSSLPDFKQQLLNLETKEWFYYFLDDSKINLFGYDRKPILQVVDILDNLTPADPAHKAIFRDTYQLLNYTFREQVILSCCVQEMQRQHVTHAYIIMGESHQKSFAELCKQWNINIQILKP